MSDAALELYQEKLKNRHRKNEARRIRSLVTQARRNPHIANLRWPFELLQNAVDPGPSRGRQSVSIFVLRKSNQIVFQHDGATFTLDDLAALLTGGSSKEFESILTTGRFGTGFLVTHVLSEHTALKGLLDAGDHYEQFELLLDRGGDEEAILENIDSCDAAIRAAAPVLGIEGRPSAEFTYSVSDENTVAAGLDALRQSLPYLFATRPMLGSVTIDDGDSREIWTAGAVEFEQFENGCVEHHPIRIERDGVQRPVCTFRFTANGGSSASLVLLEPDGAGWRVVVPEPGAPRIFREYPIGASGFLPISFVLDGKFEPDQERSRLQMGETDKQLLDHAFASATLAVKYAVAKQWADAHLLAKASRPATTFNPADDSELSWWLVRLSNFAADLACLPIVECDGRLLPAVSEDADFADFIVPRLLPASEKDETTVARMWPLVYDATGLFPPSEHLASDWSHIAAGWHELGVGLNRISLLDLAESVREDAGRLHQLHVLGDPAVWLSRFLDIVGECWTNRAGLDFTVLTRLLPNQNGDLCSPTILHRDEGVPEILKDICSEMGKDVRSQLLMNGLDAAKQDHDLPYLDKAVQQAVSSTMSESDVIEQALKHLDERLPEDEDTDDALAAVQTASVRLMHHLWTRQGANAAALARRIPLLTAKGRIARWSHDRLMMAPVCSWPESARPFSAAYPPNRVLSDIYAGDPESYSVDTVSALVQWGIAIHDPISTETPAALNTRRLAAMSSSESDAAGVVVSGETFSQIALLQPVLNHCQEPDEARALLGLILCHFAPNDPNWQQERWIHGRKAGDDVMLRLNGALWLADLRFRSWVPGLDDEGKPIRTIADRMTLEDLLDPAWLEGNDSAIRLLSERFGFDQLELRLLGTTLDPVVRQQVRNGLARLVESVGANPAMYATLAADLEARQRRRRDVERCRLFGLAVQDAVSQAITAYGFDVKLVDRGFDYEISLPSTAVEDASMKFEVGPYLLEVKATTAGGARLTPTQAEVASLESERYVLCVVDLRAISDEDVNGKWTPSAVEPLARIVADVGRLAQETYVLVEEARTNSVGIRNELALRYEVPASVWERGATISEWVARVFEGIDGAMS